MKDLGRLSARRASHKLRTRARMLLQRFRRPNLPIQTKAKSQEIVPPEACAHDENAVQQEQAPDAPALQAAGLSRPAAECSPPSQPTSHVTLWDAAYETLREEKPRVIEEYDALLEKELSASLNTAPGDTGVESPGPSNAAALGGQGGESSRTAAHCQPSADRATLDRLTKTGLERMDSKKAKLHIFGREFDVREQVSRVTGGIDFAGSWIKEAVKASPEASLVWAGVSLILPLLTNPAKADQAHHDAFLHLTKRVEDFAAIESTLDQIISSATQSLDHDLCSLARRHIIELYQHVIDFQIQSVLRSYQGWLPKLGRDLIQYDDWKQMRDMIDDAYMFVRKDIGDINKDRTRQELERACEIQNRLLTLAELKEQEEKEERLDKCHQAFRLTSEGADSSYEWFCGRIAERVEGTCQWFFNQENFVTWLKAKKGLLLVSADPGCGKSVLSKHLVTKALPRDVATLGVTICYFFFVDQSQNTLAQALCAVLHQLFDQQRGLLRHALPAFSRDGKSLSTNTLALWNILAEASRDPCAKPIIVVLDALDECIQHDLETLVRNLEDMFISRGQQEPGPVRFLLTSRPYGEITELFDELASEAPHIRIPGEEKSDAIAEEVNLVIKHRIREFSTKIRPWDEDLLEYTAAKLTAMPHRTYLWVYLVFDELYKQGLRRTKKGIDAVVEDLPHSVDQAYEKILNRSLDQEQSEGTSKTQKADIQKILNIILAAKEPMTVSEMNAAFNTRSNMESFAQLDMEADTDFEANLRSWCGLFITVYHGKIHFLHQTAREFLLAKDDGGDSEVRQPLLRWRHSCTLPGSNAVLADICVTQMIMTRTIPRDIIHPFLAQVKVPRSNSLWMFRYASSKIFESKFWGRATPLEDWVAAFNLKEGYAESPRRGSKREEGDTKKRQLRKDYGAFLPYSLINWCLHFRNAEGALAPATVHSAVSLVGFDGPRLSGFYWHNGDLSHYGDFDWAVSRLGQASALGLDRLVVHLLDDEKDDINDGGPKWSPLLWAAFKTKQWPEGALKTMQVLFARGARVDPADRELNEQLQRATSVIRNDAFIDLILAAGADIDSLFLYAAWQGELTLLDMLHRRGANVEARSSSIGETALFMSAASALVDQVRWLLRPERGANPGARDNYGDTALHRISNRHNYMCELQVPHRSVFPPESRSSFYGSTFRQHPSQEALSQAVAILVHHGADINERNEDGRSPLVIAIHSVACDTNIFGGNSSAVVETLLKAGADINLPDSEGHTPITIAMRHWLLNTCKARPDADARRRWFRRCVRLLLKQGAEIDAGSRRFLHSLSSYGSHDTPLTFLRARGLKLRKHTWARLEKQEAERGSEGGTELDVTGNAGNRRASK